MIAPFHAFPTTLLTLKQLSAEEVDATVQKGRPVLATTPYFWGHAVLILGKDEVTGNFRAADSVSGMVVPLSSFKFSLQNEYYLVEITDKEAFLASLPEPEKSGEKTIEERIMDALQNR